jgi:hypothetical protein
MWNEILECFSERATQLGWRRIVSESLLVLALMATVSWLTR